VVLWSEKRGERREKRERRERREKKLMLDHHYNIWTFSHATCVIWQWHHYTALEK
jgi:hypothetical protein